MLIHTKKNIAFMWLPSHIGIEGNEKADKYADLETNINLNPTINNIFTNNIKMSVQKNSLNLKKLLELKTINK